MIKYKSTRGDTKLYTFSEAVLKGIAHDGGLFVPEKFPKLTGEKLQSLLNSSYQEQAAEILSLFETDFSDELLKEMVHKAYGDNYERKEITPVIHLKHNQYILELWHGPTAAFKDMALQIMPLFFSEAVKRDNENREYPLKYLILVATSGDTGKAALEGYKNRENISIMGFYPKGRVSQLQELQMKTQEGNNIAVYAVEGNFDAVQTMVKDIFNHHAFNTYLDTHYQTILSSANSINWGRLVPQIVYYITAYLELVKKDKIKLGEDMDVSVPTGNFGNILAAFIAKKMGLPIRKFICASNKNNVLTDFLRTGVYDIRKRSIVMTPSPSMDILVASNIERLLYMITNDSVKVAKWMLELKTERKFTVDAETKIAMQREFYADWVSNADCLQYLKDVYTETNYLMDPHTTIAQLAAERYIKQNNSNVPMIICSTAHWSKFAKVVYESLIGSSTDKANEFEMLDSILQLDPKLTLHKNIAALKNKKILHDNVCRADKNDVEKIIGEFV